ncbi:MAG TPA: sigma-70 family RNA polymerase sigma factor [Actinomycetota bacterium]|nr:sigma-70 family RNA polymerase sigma factor [Actinomycetota bacterium]
MAAGKRTTPPIQGQEETLSPTLEQLVERGRQGDVDAFRELFERYGQRVYRYAHSRLGRAEDAQDAAQDVFLAAWQGLPSFHYEHPGSFPGWLFGIARNVVAEHHRRAFRRRWVGLDEVPEGSVEFEGRLLSQRVLLEELGRLPETQREVLMLRFVAGLPAREVGTAVGKSEAAVVSLQVRGLEALRRRLGRLA